MFTFNYMKLDLILSTDWFPCNTLSTTIIGFRLSVLKPGSPAAFSLKGKMEKKINPSWTTSKVV